MDKSSLPEKKPNRLSRWLGRSLEDDSAVEPFQLFPGHQTRPPVVVTYLHFGYGYFAPTPQADHFYRCRPYMGQKDPVTIPKSASKSHALAQSILSQERRAREGALWGKLFAEPATHVIHYGWKSLITGYTHEILYFPLNFAYPRQDADELAWEFSEYLVYCLPVLPKFDLCPPSGRLRDAQEFFLMLAFRHYFYKLIEEPRRIHL